MEQHPQQLQSSCWGCWNNTRPRMCMRGRAYYGAKEEVIPRQYDYCLGITSEYCEPSYDLMLKGCTCSASYSNHPKDHHAYGEGLSGCPMPVAR